MEPSMEPDVYLRRHHIMVYLKDATAALLEKRKKDRRVSPLAVLMEYFARVRSGTHVYGRDFSFVSATPYNRGAFVGTFWRCFYRLGRTSDVKMCVWEYHQLMQLLCPDFPSKYSDQVYRIISCQQYGNLALVKDLRLSLVDFLYMFQILFYYEDFLRECEGVFKRAMSQNPAHLGSKSMSNIAILELKKDSNCDRSKDLRSSSVVKASSDCLVSNIVIVPLVTELCHHMDTEQPWIATPSLTTISEALKGDLSFPGFVYLLYTLDGANKDIQQLPPKDLFSSTTPTTPTKGSEE